MAVYLFLERVCKEKVKRKVRRQHGSNLLEKGGHTKKCHMKQNLGRASIASCAILGIDIILVGIRLCYSLRLTKRLTKGFLKMCLQLLYQLEKI